MDISQLSAYSLSFIGDGVYTLAVRKHFVELGYQNSGKLAKLCREYNSAKGQMEAFYRLKEENFFTEEELEVYKRGRNHITHIPRNGDRVSYQTATGLEAVTGYLYYHNIARLEEMFEKIFEGDKDHE